MLDSGVIDVAIGVVLVYFLLSLLSSAVSEVIAARLRLRSKDLEAGIRSMLLSAPEAEKHTEWLKRTRAKRIGRWITTVLGVPWHLLTGSPNGSGRPEGGVAGNLFDHPLFRSLKHNDKLTSYVPSRTFSAALLDILNSPDRVELMRSQVASTSAGALRDFLDALFTPRNQAAVEAFLKGFAGRMKEEAIRSGLENVLGKGVDAVAAFAEGIQEGDVKQTILAATDEASIQNLLRRSDGLPEPLRSEAKKWIGQWDEILKAVVSLTKGVADKIDEQRKEIEKWFDTSMDRVSGWYKRRAQLIIIAISIPIVVLLNADTLTLSDSLLKNEVVREQLVNAARERVAAAEGEATGQTQETPQDLLNELKGLNVLGWKQTSPDTVDPREAPAFHIGFLGIEDALEGNDFDVAGWAWKVFGLGITILAVSQGAPFWFDILKKAVNLRGAGKAPPSTTDPASK